MRNNKNITPEDQWLEEAFSADGSKWGTPGDWTPSDNWNEPGGWKAADGDSENSERVSSPYIIQIRNTFEAASNVDIGDSYTNRTASNFGQISTIAITSTITGVTYIEFLAQSESQPFNIGRTMIISTSAGQLDQTVAVTHRDATGERRDHVITPTVDPYQNQTDRIIDDYEYLFDGYTRLRFNQINANATATVRMYPTGKFVATQLVAGRPGLPTYQAPHLIKVAPTPVARPRMISNKK